MLACGKASTGGLTRVGARSGDDGARGEPQMAPAGSRHSRSGGGGPDERWRARANPVAMDGLDGPVDGLSGRVYGFFFFFSFFI
jgi:hypothetical protein